MGSDFLIHAIVQSNSKYGNMLLYYPLWTKGIRRSISPFPLFSFFCSSSSSSKVLEPSPWRTKFTRGIDSSSRKIPFWWDSPTSNIHRIIRRLKLKELTKNGGISTANLESSWITYCYVLRRRERHLSIEMILGPHLVWNHMISQVFATCPRCDIIYIYIMILLKTARLMQFRPFQPLWVS